ERAFGQVEQRADARIGLAVVVAERALVVAAQASDAPVGDKRPVVAEALVHFELNRLVFALRVFVGIWLAVGLELAAEPRAGIQDELLRSRMGCRRWIRDRPSRAVHTWEAGAAHNLSESVADVSCHVWSGLIVAVDAGRRQTGRFQRSGVGC